jgi:uncharacterized repeat protein (TIGR03803 family)
MKRPLNREDRSNPHGAVWVALTKVTEARISRTRLCRVTTALAALVVFGLSVVVTPSAKAQTLSVLHSFAGGDGAGPQAGLVMDTAGNLYGTTGYGGSGPSFCSFGCGTVFKLDPAGNETVLHTFGQFPTGGSDGARPFSNLIMDAVGNLYGTTGQGGASGAGISGFGTVFKLDTSGNETVLYNFTGGGDGAIPGAGVIRDARGNLYGTTAVGGASPSVIHGGPGLGTVVKLDPAGNETVLHSFMGFDGDYPVAGLIMDAAGNLYGTTSSGGSFRPCVTNTGSPFGCGLVFKLDPSGNETVLYNFTGGSDGFGPGAALTMDGAGNLYGTAFRGGIPGGAAAPCPSGCGTVFKIDPSGNFSVLHTFTGSSDGSNPTGALIMDSGGNLYGTTSDNDNLPGFFGTVFKLDSVGNHSILHSFTGGSDGSEPRGDLIMDTAGNLYGTTSVGGSFGGGTVFKLTIQPPDTIPPVTVASLNPPPNSNGWNRSNVTVTLTSTDNEHGGTGVKEIQFSATGAQPMSLQTVGGSTATLVITTEGITTVTYFATDNSNNVENPKTITVRLEKTSPVISGLPSPGCALWPPNHKFVQVGDVKATDLLSGLAPGSLNVTGTSNEPSNPNDPDILVTSDGSGGFTVQLRAERDGNGNGRVYTLTATATDLAGNLATATATCTVSHDQRKN